MPVIEYTREQFDRLLAEREYDQASVNIIHGWFDRGDGAAVYENHDLGHPDLGHHQIVSYGSAAAQLETDDPPDRLPDIGRINWRYLLIGKYRPERKQP